MHHGASRCIEVHLRHSLIFISLVNCKQSKDIILKFEISYFWKFQIMKNRDISRQILKITKLWVAKKNSHTHTCAHTRMCAMCVRKGFQIVRAMCVRAAIFLVCDMQSQFRTFLDKKGLILAIDLVHFKHIAVCAAIRWYDSTVCMTVRFVRQYGLYDSTVCTTVRFVWQYGLYDSTVVKLYAKFRLCI